MGRQQITHGDLVGGGLNWSELGVLLMAAESRITDLAFMDAAPAIEEQREFERLMELRDVFLMIRCATIPAEERCFSFAALTFEQPDARDSFQLTDFELMLSALGQPNCAVFIARRVWQIAEPVPVSAIREYIDAARERMAQVVKVLTAITAAPPENAAGYVLGSFTTHHNDGRRVN